MAWLAFALLLLALALFAVSAGGIVHKRVQFIPLGLFFVLLAVLLRYWPPP